MERAESSCDEEDCKEEMVVNKDDELELAKAEMGEVREENKRLRLYLEQMMKDYQTLQKQFNDTVQQEPKNPTNHADQEMEESDLISLSLGRTSSTDLKKDIEKFKNVSKNEVNDEQDKEGLVLGLDCKFEVSKIKRAESYQSPENSLEEVKEDAGQTWPPPPHNNNNNGLKTTRNGDDEVSQQNPAKKARVSVRVRCDTPTMNDGCQWRKYGQKIAKGNPCPRAYYRCTVAPSCPVRKQVQRCAEDMSILITTYEGTHNHSLPVSATAMASTTSAAASMLMSGSSTSGTTLNPQSATTFTELHGLNFDLSSDNSKSKPFYLPNSSISSSSPSCPTITLDLTSTPSSSSHFNRISSNFPPRYFTTNLNFSSLDQSNTLPMNWANGALSYGSQSQANSHPYNKNQMGPLNFARTQQENVYQSYMQKTILPPTQQSLPPDTIEAATKAITADPSFQSALAAALTSIIGSGSGAGAGEKFGQNLKLSEQFPVLSSFPSTSNSNNCTSSYLNKSQPPSANSQSRGLMFLPPSLPLSNSKSKSTSPEDNRDRVV
ncbi:hypothetical protein LguiA_028203 [Lonicera macranthoides]